ncbi:bifunctional lysylphosphatidylglycerol flippase/synthetase MprF [Vagococcus salmoninarum]|uniref:bifunctional lysylphosphatidylglycerol flippase/synthetase MprF n=3 Tax=Vagococcus salmoninarum TaxID=2739 RepID=UPI003F9C518B
MKELLKKLSYWLKKYSSILKIIFLFSVLLFVINQMTSILQGMTWLDLKNVLLGQGRRNLLKMVAVGLVAVLPMLTYDWVTLDILEEQGKPRLPRKELFTSGWTTNTINNLAGFGGVIGATLRGRFYGSGVGTRKVITTVSKVAIFMLSGLSVLCLITLSDIFIFRPNNPYRTYWIWLLGGSLYTPLLISFIKLKGQKLFADFSNRRLALLVLGSFGQWLGALGAFLVIGFIIEVPVDLLQVYPLFVTATFIGMISMVPGGMGTFDVLMIVGLGHVGISKELALAWLLYYRIFYYLIPFLTGIFSYLHQTSAKINQFFDELPQLFAQKTAHFILVCMVYFAGVMMILLSTVPNLSNLSWLFQKIMPFSFDFLDQTLNMLIGFLLLGLARGVSHRVKKAYLPLLAVLIFCIANTVTRDISWKLLLFYGFLIACVYWSRREFYRKQLLFTWESLIFDGVLYGLLFILYSVVGFYSTERLEHGELPAKFLLFPSEDVWLQGLAGVVLAAITIYLLYHYLGSQEKPGVFYDDNRVSWLLEKYGGTSYSHLVFLKDKRNYYYQEKGWDKVFFTFEIQSSKLFVLGDPVGKSSLFHAATSQFLAEADKLGYQLVFYGITDDYALSLHDLGFDFMKLGEEAQLNLRAEDSLSRNFHTKNLSTERLANQGYTFQYYEGPHSEELLREVAKVSEIFNQGREERYFAVGRFNINYLNHGDIGVVYNEFRELVAFCSVRIQGDNGFLAYELLRYKEDLPEGITDFLLIHILETCQKRQVANFSFGLAPLAKVGEAQTAFMKERLLHTCYKYSYPITNFKDIRLFKDSFSPDWQGRYLSYPKNTNSVFLMLQLYLLIEGGKSRRTRPVEGIMFE